jgi:hypothetical protein
MVNARAVLGLALAGCAGVAGCGAPPAGTVVRAGALGGSDKLDVLFMIKNAGMDSAEANLKTNLPALMDVLKNRPEGLPDLHLAVITSDMGAGDGSFTACSGDGDGGVFQYGPGVGCTATNLNAGATFVATTGGANFTGDVTAVAQCLITVGSAGCPFGHPLASIARALGADGTPPPAENQGFLRADAMLAIILLTDEDDCSAPASSPLFDYTGSASLAGPVGPPSTYRCSEFGVVCGTPGAAPPRLSPTPTDLSTTVTLDGCRSNEASPYLPAVAPMAAAVKALKADPARQILVAAIAGPLTPYTVRWQTPSVADTGPWPDLEPSCDGGNAIGVGLPAVRITDWVHAFGDNGLSYSICTNSFAPALEDIATHLVNGLAVGGDAGGPAVAPDAGGDAGNPLVREGCGCTAGAGAPPGEGALALVALAVLSRARRPARRRRA